MPDKKTIFYDLHVSLDAVMAPFGGFLMPIQYSGIIGEHEATRTGAALFDTCHMGEFLLSGSGVVADLDNIVSCNVADMVAGQCRYGMMCNEQGGVIDDLLVYRMGDDFTLVVNAGTQDSDFEWIGEHLSSSTRLVNASERTAKVDIQGPGSPEIVEQVLDGTVADMAFYRHKGIRYKGEDVLISRTGYTGEIGFELYCGHDLALSFWRDAMAQGAVPAGLGARDTLRLEMGMPLCGHELGPTRNAAGSGLARSLSTAKRFIGSDAVSDPSRRTSQLVGILFEDRRAARGGDWIVDADGAEIGQVTSGSFAPSIGVAVALGYVAVSAAQEGGSVTVRTDRKPLEGRIVPTPFYTKATGRQPVTDFLKASRPSG